MDLAIRRGLKISFLIIASYMAIMLLASMALAHYDPQLEFASRIAPHFGYEPHNHCVFCGMTHSFVACSQGYFRQAALANPMGPPLYFLFLLLTAIGIVIVLRDWAARRCQNEA